MLQAHAWGASGFADELSETKSKVTHQVDWVMNSIRETYVKANQLVGGQTMTEYALILAAVAVVVFAGYQIMGTDINNLLSSIDSLL